MPSPLPRRNNRVRTTLASPVATAFLLAMQSRLPYQSFRGLLSVHYSLRPAYSPGPYGPSSPKASAASLPPRLLRLLPAGATVAGRVFHPQGVHAFSRRTWLSIKLNIRQVGCFITNIPTGPSQPSYLAAIVPFLFPAIQPSSALSPRMRDRGWHIHTKERFTGRVIDLGYAGISSALAPTAPRSARAVAQIH